MMIFLPLSLFVIVVVIQQIAKSYLARQQSQERARKLGAHQGWTNRGPR